MVYCVEDDHSIRDLMIYTLTIAGFEAQGFADGVQFWEAMQSSARPELVLRKLGKGSVFTVKFPKKQQTA